MDRRDFLKAAGFAGLNLVAPRLGSAATPPSDAPFLITVHCSGGWDTTLFCDPKGRKNEDDPAPINPYFRDDIEEEGNLRFAPISGNRAFFRKYYRELLVLNGIDVSTNSHLSGLAYTWCGRLSSSYPSLSALMAGGVAPELPLSFISNGGYDQTQGLVALTRSGSLSKLPRIAFPNRPSTTNPSRLFHSEETAARIRKALDERTRMLQKRQRLPKIRAQLSALRLVRSGNNELEELTRYLPELDESDNILLRQAQFALAAFRAGVSVSCNMILHGFDSHSSHDRRHPPLLTQLTQGLDFILEEAERQRVRDRLMVVVGSEFGRTPFYNDGKGKDHWSITSMMMLGPGIQGNRVIGGTNGRLEPHPLNPKTLAIDPEGERLKPDAIHMALRKLLRLENAQDQFPLVGPTFELFATEST